jgi:hypothetical protein
VTSHSFIDLNVKGHISFFLSCNDLDCYAEVEKLPIVGVVVPVAKGILRSDIGLLIYRRPKLRVAEYSNKKPSVPWTITQTRPNPSKALISPSTVAKILVAQVEESPGFYQPRSYSEQGMAYSTAPCVLNFNFLNVVLLMTVSQPLDVLQQIVGNVRTPNHSHRTNIPTHTHSYGFHC